MRRERSEIRNDKKKEYHNGSHNYRQETLEILSEILLITNNFIKFLFSLIIYISYNLISSELMIWPLVMSERIYRED